jgi:DNA-binding CsgD family transcriptional regulator
VARPVEVAPLILAAYELTERERTVAALVLGGRSTEQIADELSISPSTVQQHLKSVFDKVGVRSRRELVAQIFARHYAPRMLAGGHLGGDGRPTEQDYVNPNPIQQLRPVETASGG